MYIKYGDTGYIVDYIQEFLKKNFSDSVIVSGIYDRFTHNSLIKYLELPEVKDMNEVYSELESRYNINKYFYVEREIDNINFTSFSEDTDTVNFMAEIYDSFKELIYNLGWKILEYTNYRSLNKGKYIIRICKSRENKIPNEELISMVNKFDGTYYYDFYLDNDNGQIVQKQGCGYKLAMIPCDPDTEYTIAHGYNDIIQIGICSYREYSIGNMRPIEKYETGYITKTGHYIYKTSSNAKYILVQVPYVTLATHEFTSRMILGDINFDNKLDQSDVDLMQKIINNRAAVDNEFFEVYDINGDGLITNEDLFQLVDLVNNQDIRYVNKTVELVEDSIGTTLLVMKYFDIKEYKIPIEDYNKDMWMIHDKLVSYILGMCITKYSRQDDISYLHDIMIGVNPTAKTGISGIYTDELKGYVREYQFNNNVSFAFGYLDLDTEKLILESGV